MILQLNEQTRVQIRRVIGLYKDEFDHWIPHELYKWRAVGWFQQNWKQDAADFSAMMSEALSKTGNLMDSGFGYPRATILKLAKTEPEAVRRIFAQLEDEGVPLTDRIRAFKNSVALLWERYREPNAKKKHFQDDRAVCRYLFFLHPEKYYLYQYGKYMEFTREIGLEPGRWSADSAYVPKYMDLADCVREEVERDLDLAFMLKERLDPSWYQDENHHLLADDIFWFAYSVLCRKNYWPGENEYEPGIDAEQWRTLLRNESVCSEKRRRILLQMMSMGGEVTCTQLAQRYGESFHTGRAFSITRIICQTLLRPSREKPAVQWPSQTRERRSTGLFCSSEGKRQTDSRGLTPGN